MHIVDYSIVFVYLIVMVLVGLWLQKKASSGIDSYFLGNRSIPWWALSASGMSSNLDITGTMINTALLFSLGLAGFFIEIRGGVTLVMAFLMIFMGKWNRRAEVMTLAEWMHLRFGEGKDGHAARVICAIGWLILTIALVTYFCKGAGKFIAEFLEIAPYLGMAPDFWAALLMIVLAMIYTVASGLHGVVWTDVFQSIFIFGTIVGICFICVTSHPLPDTFELSSPVDQKKLEEWNKGKPTEEQIVPGKQINENYKLVEKDGESYKVWSPSEQKMVNKKYVVWSSSKEEWTDLTPKSSLSIPEIGEYSMFNLLGLLIFFYLIRVILEGSGGLGGYMSQRFFAVASDREAGLMSLLWIFLLSFRWPFIASIAIMGISYSTQQGVTMDPELVLPTVINNLVPIGLKGFLVAGLMAAAMSTFDSTVNSGAAYWVKDIYQAYLKKDASEKELIWQSKFASLGIVVIALIFSVSIENINEIWSWITMGIGAGMFMPLVIRWYWWRLNGWGFTGGMFGGMVAAIVSKAMLPTATPEYIPFTIIIIVSTICLIVFTLITKPNDEKVLQKFYNKTRPFGLWGKVRNSLPAEVQAKIKAENKRDIVSTFFAVPWQIVLFLTWMMILFRRWDQLWYVLSALIVTTTVLYFNWFRHLSAEVDMTDSN